MAFHEDMKPIHRRIGRIFIDSYAGIQREVWWLSLIMLINRSGSMVFPFMSIYLTHHLNFNNIQAGWILSSFGVGSMIGSLSGGWLSDKYGNFKVQFFSLLLGGIGWLFLAHVTEYYSLLILVLVQSSISDAMRPANASSVTMFTTPQSRTQSFSLNRMAMNMGYTVGPAIGGVFATISYTWLFWADGFTCIIASIVFLFLFRSYFNIHKEEIIQDSTDETIMGGTSPLKDGLFMGFIVCTTLFAGVFFQLLFTLPVYYKEVYMMSEFGLGALMASNGLIVFVLEMIFVYTVGQRVKKEVLILIGVLTVGLSFVMLNWVHGVIWLIFGMVVISFGEIMAMPFMQTFVANRAAKKSLGKYLAWYSFAYSGAMIFSPVIGMWTIKEYGFVTLWNACMLLSILTSIGLYFIFRLNSKRNLIMNNEQ